MLLPIDAGSAVLRGWRGFDVVDLVSQADNRAVWRNMTHTFPHPYTRKDAEAWVAGCLDQEPPRDVVVAVDGRLAGVCGITLGSGVSEFTGSVGYWLGEEHWGQGIMTTAFAAFLRYVWHAFDVQRLQAEVFAWNPASARVMEKNGFVREGTRRQAIFKNDAFVDEWFYSRLRGDSA